jgi:hypothetical protein
MRRFQEEVLKRMIEDLIKIIDAKAWVRKYLIEASEVEGFGLNKIRGTKLIKLISRPTQAKIHEEEHITSIVLRIKEINVEDKKILSKIKIGV